ncbi:hypothetical protein COB21_00935 [Candidatus Aerophobetes bacterium]|uniref:Uncharacterized protein n=1 Tax=Aerophobetes bacterium TaxID=2030807 RepID=A0A2A4X724_UNCAE|nr:MAG: hypothetical protein COB21_00935 [Candidatus Aerophobetes bacterium]
MVLGVGFSGDSGRGVVVTPASAMLPEGSCPQETGRVKQVAEMHFALPLFKVIYELLHPNRANEGLSSPLPIDPEPIDPEKGESQAPDGSRRERMEQNLAVVREPGSCKGFRKVVPICVCIVTVALLAAAVAVVMRSAHMFGDQS